MPRTYRVSGVLAAALLAGCAVGPDYEPPKLETPQTYTAEYVPPQRIVTDLTLWWEGFQDPTLDDLVERALDGNVEIGIAVARLAEARALANAQWSGLFPVIDGAADGSSVWDSDSGDVTTSGSGGAVMSFTPDIFGGQRRRIEQARAAAKAAGYTIEDVRRLTASSVAQQYVNLRRTQSQLQLLETSLELQGRTLEIVRQRSEAGLSANLDVQRATADLARTRARRGSLITALARAQNGLAVLLGQSPGGEIAPAKEDDPIPSYAGGPPVGVPADLLRQRPDLMAAEADLVAATAGIGVNVANLYPSFQLPGRVTADFGDVQGMAGAVTAVISAAIDIPLLDFGRRRAQVRAAEQRAQAALLTYRQTLLESLGQVENALAAIEGARERRDELAKAIEASEQAFSQLNALYREGLATFIDILDGQRTLISNRESYVDAEADLAQAVISLYQALGAPTDRLE